MKQQLPLSLRGLRILELGQQVLLGNKTKRDAYDEVTNPQGIIDLGIAENTLMQDELKQYFENNFKLGNLDLTYGDRVSGSSRLSRALAGFFNKKFHPILEVEIDHIVTLGGATAIIDQMLGPLTEEGDGILIAAPYYNGFDNDVQIRQGVHPVLASIPHQDIGQLAELSRLEATLQETHAVGKTRIKTVMLCNPHNPLGQCYEMETLVAYGVFCEKHNLHLISDEIYAMSIFPSVETPHPKPFISVLSIDFASIGVNLQRIHVVYGMSKDFAANGLHIGVLISQHNPQLLQAVTATSIFSAVSTPAAVLWSTLLEDTHYLESFLSTSRNKLTYAYEWITQWLQHHKIKYIPSSVGHFVLISLIDWLSDDDTFNKVIGSTSDKPLDMREKEKALFYHLRKHKVGMKMGAVYHVSEPGWFRLTFTIRESVMRLALRRFEDALGWHHWAPEGSPLSHHELRLASRL